MSKKNYWENLSKNITTPSQTKNKRPDTTDFEIEFYKKFIKKKSDLLDIGSGAGLIVNKLTNYVKNITAVEKYIGFSKFISNKPNVLVINADLIGFRLRKEFDSILCTGVGQCFGSNNMQSIYQNIFSMTKSGGIFISRMHCGISEDVIVDKYSKELKTDYYAEFRHVEKEKKTLLKIGYSKVDIYDILPDEINVWENTRHYIFVCYKNN